MRAWAGEGRRIIAAPAWPDRDPVGATSVAMRIRAAAHARNGRPRRASGDAVIPQLLAQRGAMDAEHRRGAALVAVAMVEHFGEQRDLEFAQRDFVEVRRWRSRRGRAGNDEPNWRRVRAAAGARWRDSECRWNRMRSAFKASPCNVQSSDRRCRRGEESSAGFSASANAATVEFQRKSKVNATTSCAGSTTSKETSRDWPLASLFCVTAPQGIRRGLNARAPATRPSASDSVSSNAGHGCGQRASLRKPADTCSTPGWRGSGRTSRSSRVNAAGSRQGGNVQCSAVAQHDRSAVANAHRRQGARGRQQRLQQQQDRQQRHACDASRRLAEADGQRMERGAGVRRGGREGWRDLGDVAIGVVP